MAGNLFCFFGCLGLKKDLAQVFDLAASSPLAMLDLEVMILNMSIYTLS